jgi:hypothetical protein
MESGCDVISEKEYGNFFGGTEGKPREASVSIFIQFQGQD